MSITIKNLSATLAALALAGMTAQAAAPSLSYKISDNELIITYTGTLYQSSDAVVWSQVTAASSPYKVALGDKKQFFCAKAEEGPSKNITIPLSEDVDLEMIWINPGTFTMGSPEDELGRQSDEVQHQVTLTQGYWLGKFEITQAQYEAVTGENPSRFKGADLPVEQVTWNDAKEFCVKLTEIERTAGRLPSGYEYTLPTEAQWEYACRAGTTTALNSGKNLSDEVQCPEMDEVGWYGYNSDKTTHPVGQKQPNAWGLYDMHGNVYEWCLDWYKKDYPVSSVTDPTGPDTGDLRVLRGGSWYYYAYFCRSAYRCSFYPDGRDYDCGFRVALSKSNKGTLTITINDTKAYDGIHLVSGYSIASASGLLDGDKLTAGAATSAGSEVGSYSYPGTSTITTPFETAMGIANYDVTYVINQTITRPSLTITINDSKVYGGNPLVSDYSIATVTGLMPGDSLTSGRVQTSSGNAGSYNYPLNSVIIDPFETAMGITSYDVTYVINQMITPAPLTITINDSKKYDGTPLVSSYLKVAAAGLGWYDELTDGAVMTSSGDMGIYSYPDSSVISTPFETAKGIGNYTVTYNIKQSIIEKEISPGENVTVPLSNEVALDLNWIEPGTFLMGSPEDELGRSGDETRHQVTLTQGYWMGKYEITQAQYEAVMGENPSRFTGADRPVENVSWEDAMAFCAKLTAIEQAAGLLPEGYMYTLPTEAQWEYACRAGTTTAFNNGTNIETEDEIYGKCPNLDEVGWYKYNSDDTHPAGQKKPNAWGLYDMHGNVWEWCLDRKSKYPTEAVTDPVGEGTDDYRARRGGSYDYYNCEAKDCRSAARKTGSISMTNSDLGFRVVLTKSKKRVLTIMINDTKSYDGTPLVSTYSNAPAFGLMADDGLTAGAVTSAGSEVGSYSYPGTSTITTPFETKMGIANYDVTYVINQTITRPSLTITIYDSKVYDGTPLTSSYSIASASGLLAGDKLTSGAVMTGSANAASYSYPDSSVITIPFETAKGIGKYTVTYNIYQMITETLPDKSIVIPMPVGVDLTMIWIEPGTFLMGSPKDELGRDNDERWENEVQHQVTLTKGYWMGRYEVTQAQYKAVMGLDPSHFSGDNNPVEYVTWGGARDFCARLTAQEKAAGRLPEGYEYTLPTEAQWEYACRAGTTTALNNGKNLSDTEQCSEMDEVGWYGYNSGEFDSEGNWTWKGTTHPVGQKKPNAWGLYDMHGNVWEWCLDWYEKDYPTTPVTDPKGPDTGLRRVLRGGNWNRTASYCRSAVRNCSYVGDFGYNYGFRVALVCTSWGSEGENMTIPLSNTINLDLNWIEPGTFTMGSPSDEVGRWSNEVQHQVTLTKGYWIGKYEVTQAQYKAVTGKNPSYYSGENNPVEQVTWNDAKNFCAKLTADAKASGKLPEGYEFTLPTEAQWEYACRAGTTTALNSGKNLSGEKQCPEMDEVGWYAGNTNKIHEVVGQKLPNAWGLYDMHGNVMEWCLNWYGDYPTSSVTDPTGPSTGTRRVIRGGSSNSEARSCRSAWRDSSSASSRSYGFRVALVPVKE